MAGPPPGKGGAWPTAGGRIWTVLARTPLSVLRGVRAFAPLQAAVPRPEVDELRERLTSDLGCPCAEDRGRSGGLRRAARTSGGAAEDLANRQAVCYTGFVGCSAEVAE